MFLRILLAVGLAFGIGCSKPPAAPRPNAAEGSGEAPADASGASEQARLAAVLNELTQVVRRYSAEQRRAPKNVEELVTGGYLTAIPAAPAGKKFAINKNLQVYLANQ
jgi:hypothetical protein